MKHVEGDVWNIGIKIIGIFGGYQRAKRKKNSRKERKPRDPGRFFISCGMSIQLQ
jgi:hypothetical protein